MELIENFLQGKIVDTNVLITMFLSLYGLTIATILFKSVPEKIFNVLKRHFTTNLLISSADNCFYSLVKLLEENKIANKTRSIRLMNGRYGENNNISKSIGIGNHYFFYKNVFIIANYNIEKTDYNCEKIHVNLTKLGRSHKIFDELMKELQRILETENKNEDKNHLTVYSFNRENYQWYKEVKIIKRNFNSIFIEDNIRDRLINHLDNFYSKENWYHERGIPYQTGICLHGPAGTGKTSIVKGLASYYNKNLCILRSSELNELPKALQRLPNECFIVIEDIDTSSIVIERNKDESLEEALYNIRYKSKSDELPIYEEAPPNEISVEDSGVGSLDKQNKNKKGIKNSLKNAFNNDMITPLNAVLLSDVLNAMDGLISIDKRVIIFTTNHLEKLDRALIRPGRIDCIERIDYISYTQFKRFCNLFYKDTITKENKNKLNNVYSKLITNVTVAELQKNFMQEMKLDEMILNYCE